MKIEVGKKYVTESGVVVGPMKAQGAYFIEETPNVMSITFDGVRESWDCNGLVMHGSANDMPNTIVSEFSDEPKKISVKEGGYYKTAEGVIEGPMIRGADCWKSAKPKTKQCVLNGMEGQIWEDDGSVAAICHGEELHHFVEEVSDPNKDADEIERLKSVIASQKAKLDRVQNIHANTIKTLRKARADVKKVNKALSEEQGRTMSLSRRLAEVVKAATDAAEYVKGIERTSPKVKRAVAKVGVGMTEIWQIERLESLCAGDFSEDNINKSFWWDTTPQGVEYWDKKHQGKERLTSVDINFFKALLDKYNASK